MLVCDTSGLIAYFDASDKHCSEITAVMDADEGPFVVSPYVIAELDYLVATRRGLGAELSVLAELTGGAWELPSIDATDLEEIGHVIERYSDQQIGVTDASLVVLADRYRTNRLLTLDRRHFAVIRPLSGRQFDLLPA